MECLDPPLQEVPVDEWFCPECAAPGAAPAAGNTLPPLRWSGPFLWGRPLVPGRSRPALQQGRLSVALFGRGMGWRQGVG